MTKNEIINKDIVVAPQWPSRAKWGKTLHHMEMDLYHVGFNPTRFVWGSLTNPLYIVEAPIPHRDLIDNCDDNCYFNQSNNIQDWLDGWLL